MMTLYPRKLALDIDKRAAILMVTAPKVRLAVTNSTASPASAWCRIKAYPVSDLSSATLIRCLALIEEGGAVDVKSASVTMMRSSLIVTARVEKVVVGVGVLKPYRPDYAVSITEKCGMSPPVDAPEIGYVAVAPAYRGKGIAHLLMDALCAAHGGSLFATTSDKTLKKYMMARDFRQVGHEWEGRRGDQLSLWVRVLSA